MPFEQTFTVFNNLSGQGVTFVLAVLISYFQKVWNCLLYDHYSNRLRRTRAQLNQTATRELPFGLSFREILKLSLALLHHIIHQICCSMVIFVEIYVFQRVLNLRVDSWLKITASVMFRCNLFQNHKSFTPWTNASIRIQTDLSSYVSYPKLENLNPVTRGRFIHFCLLRNFTFFIALYWCQLSTKYH